jgi:hypothetical protein
MPRPETKERAMSGDSPLDAWNSKYLTSPRAQQLHITPGGYQLNVSRECVLIMISGDCELTVGSVERRYVSIGAPDRNAVDHPQMDTPPTNDPGPVTVRQPPPTAHKNGPSHRLRLEVGESPSTAPVAEPVLPALASGS